MKSSLLNAIFRLLCVTSILMWTGCIFSDSVKKNQSWGSSNTGDTWKYYETKNTTSHHVFVSSDTGILTITVEKKIKGKLSDTLIIKVQDSAHVHNSSPESKTDSNVIFTELVTAYNELNQGVQIIGDSGFYRLIIKGSFFPGAIPDNEIRDSVIGSVIRRVANISILNDGIFSGKGILASDIGLLAWENESNDVDVIGTEKYFLVEKNGISISK